MDTIADETDTTEAIGTRLEAMLTAVLNRIKLVVITLGEGDDAQVIFETLNSKGRAVAGEMDLVRNNIFYRAEKEEATEVEGLYQRGLWGSLRPRLVARGYTLCPPNSTPDRPFPFAHVLAAQTGDKISMRELYAQASPGIRRAKGRPRFKQVEDELRVLGQYAPIYETLEGRIQR